MIDVTATARCDMCGREHEVNLKSGWAAGKLDTDALHIVQDVPHWELLDSGGYSVKGYRESGKVLCESCARTYKETLKRQREEINALFGK